jgi:hypothetical protein
MRQPSTIFEPFEIAVVPFPFVDVPIGATVQSAKMATRCSP